MTAELRAAARAVAPIWALWVAGLVIVLAIARAAGHMATPRHQPGGFLSPLVGWDANWYEAIARHGYGYGSGRAYAFYPLWPALLRLAGDGWWVLALVLSLAASLLAFAAIAALAPRADARAVAIALAVWPGSFLLLLAYPDGAVTALMAAACLAALRQRPALAGAIGAAASLGRPTGVLVAIPVALLVEGPLGRRAVAALPPVAAAVAVQLYFWRHSGNIRAFSHAQDLWNRHFPSLGPWPTRIRHGYHAHTAAALVAGVLIAALLAAWLVARRRWLALAAYGVLSVGSLGTIHTTNSAVELPRLVLVIVPAAVLLFRRTRELVPWAAYVAAVLVLSLGGGTIEGLGRQILIAFPLIWAVAEGPALLRRPAVVIAAGAVNLGLVLTLTRFAP